MVLSGAFSHRAILQVDTMPLMPPGSRGSGDGLGMTLQVPSLGGSTPLKTRCTAASEGIVRRSKLWTFLITARCPQCDFDQQLMELVTRLHGSPGLHLLEEVS